MSIPKTMKGILVETTGGPEVLQYRTDLPVPTPKEGQLLIKNEIIGINYIDTYFRTGLYKAPKPEILGREAAGTVVASASSPAPYGLEPGTRVVWMSSGGYAEYTAVDAQNVLPVPDDINLQKACAAFLQGLTALTLIDEAHRVERGDWILVPAAAGGTGGWLCQLLKIRGAHTIAAASTPDKRKLAESYGAEVVVPYEHILETVKERTGGEGVAAVFDGVGKSTFDTSLEAVKRKGTVVSFGNASGAPEPLVLARLTAKNCKVARPTLNNYIVEREEKESYMKELWYMLGQGVRVEVHKVYPLSEVAQAHIDLEGRKTTGKLLLKP